MHHIHTPTLAPSRPYLMRSAAGFVLSLALANIAATTAFAQTTIGTETTTPLTTSDSGDITITGLDVDTTLGSIILTDEAGPAVTVNSDNAVINDGAITIESDGDNGVDNAIGVLLEGGANRSYTQSGDISIIETFAPADTDDDNIPDGPFAQGTGRTGILISGASPFEGNVELQAGSNLIVEGNDSFGINLENTALSQGGLTGNLFTDGTIAISGNNNTAINVAGNVSGDVNNSGGISVIGGDSGAFNITGDIDGGFINSGVILNSGFRTNTRPTNATGVSGRDLFDAEDLQNAASAINIESNIEGGIFLEQRLEPILDVNGDPVLNTDGSVQMQVVGVSAIQQFGSASAIAINGDGVPISIGTVAAINDPNNTDFDASQQFAFINQGTLTASGVFDDFDATVFSVSNATLEGGISNEGTLAATTFVSPVDLEDPTRGSGIARLIVLGDQAIAEQINNSGILIATASEAIDAVFVDINNPIAPRDVTAIAIDITDTATTNTIINTGSLAAVIVGRQGTAIAIRDTSGTLTSVTNTNILSASGINSDPLGNAATDFDLVAVDVSNNTSGFTFSQFQQEDLDPNDGIAPLVPATAGDILLGSGDDSVIASAGTITGDIDFADGDDLLDLSGGTDFIGAIDNQDGLIINVSEASTLTVTQAANINITEATFTGSTNYSPVIDGLANGAANLTSTGDITFASGATVTPILNNIIGITQSGQNSFAVATAGGDLTIGDLTSLGGGINPFLFNTSFSQEDNALIVTLDLRDPNAAVAQGGLGLDAAQAGVDNTVFTAVLENLSQATELGDVFANITDSDSFNRAYTQILPEISAATRQFILAGVDGTTGAVGTHLDATRRSPDKPGGAWLQHFAYFADRELAGQSEQFRGSGFGFTGGVDTAWGPFHAIGLNLGFSSTEIEDVVGQDEPLDVVTVQGGAYAGLEFGKLSFSAYGGGGYSDFEQNRQVSIDDFFGTAEGDWNGTHINGSLRAGYDIDLSDKYWIRPSVSVDYLRLSENAYTETGTFGVALDVDERTTDVGSASAVINLGARYQGRRTWVRPSVRVGYKYDFINDPTVTNFRFAGGNNGSLDFLSTQTAELQSFLFPDQGLLLGFSLSAGSAFSSVSLDVDSDIRNGFIRHTGRLVFRILF
ncbi:MAG: autotransporter domain-containing protein [Litorimonas sp.]